MEPTTLMGVGAVLGGLKGLFGGGGGSNYNSNTASSSNSTTVSVAAGPGATSNADPMQSLFSYPAGDGTQFDAATGFPVTGPLDTTGNPIGSALSSLSSTDLLLIGGAILLVVMLAGGKKGR